MKIHADLTTAAIRGKRNRKSLSNGEIRRQSDVDARTNWNDEQKSAVLRAARETGEAFQVSETGLRNPEDSAEAGFRQRHMLDNPGKPFRAQANLNPETRRGAFGNMELPHTSTKVIRLPDCRASS